MKKLLLTFSIIFFSANIIFSQNETISDTLIENATLDNCINYALSHQPSVQNSLINEKIVDHEIKNKLSDWFPQLNFNFNFQHNYKLQTSVFQGNTVHFGVVNTSSAQFSINQTIFNRDVLLASSTASDVRNQVQQLTSENKIDVVVNVSKAFYSVLAAQSQIDIVNEDITRLQQSKKDTYYQYKSGVVDKTDYMRATIALNNALAERKRVEEQLKSSYAFLKEQMGCSPKSVLKLVYDTDKMENDISIDTTETINYENRIEYKLLRTGKRLQEANLNYYKWSFIPSLSAFGVYNYNYLNDKFSQLYSKAYPSSYVGLQLTFPIFQGGKRIQEIQQAELEVDRYNYDLASLESRLNTQYVQALSNYKSDLKNYNAQKENVELAKEVYNTIQLQYKSGVKAYLDVITAEAQLRTTEVNYIDALYRLLSSKLDLQKALGTVNY